MKTKTPKGEEGNIVSVCKECSDQRRKDWQKKNKHMKIAKNDFVKIAFKQKIKKKNRTEHMWVKVYKETSKGYYVGVLDNVPIFISNYKIGDVVTFQHKEIEEHLSAEQIGELNG